MTDWRQTTLDQLVRLKRGHDLPTAERRAGRVPVVGAAGPNGFHDTAIVEAPGVTLGRAGASMGKATYCDVDFWPLNTSLYVTDFLGNDPRFVFYLLGQIDFSGYNSGAAQPMLNRNYITRIPITLPEPAEQRAISEALGALDDKIVTNERIATKARELGTSIFDEAVHSGSVSTSVEALAIYLNRGQSPKYTADETGLMVLNQKCVRDGRVRIDPARLTEDSRVSLERRLVANDVLVNSTGVGTLGRVGIWSHDINATVDSHITIVRINPTIVPPIIGAFALLSAQSTIEALGEGSTGQTELRRSKLGRVEIDLPSADREALADILEALEARSDAALRECRTLAALRDTLIPQLMSGNLRIRDAERCAEEAT